jgi:hypothetical protein
MAEWLIFGGVFVTIALATLFVSRVAGRGRVDVGAVSEGWLAHHRGEPFDPSR